MAIALFSFFRSFFAAATRPAQGAVTCVRQPVMRVQGGHKCPPYVTPGRAVRVVHKGQGRMVISGRLADVCAELDRLVAQEARSAQALAPAR